MNMVDIVSNLKHENKILVVDDEPYLLEGLFDVLEQEGFKITTCKTAEEAKNISKKIEFKIALIDLKMPNSDGITLARYLKQYNLNLEIIMLTAYPSQETAIESLKLGLSDYLIKPISMDELIQAINNALEKTETTKDLELLRSQVYNTYQELDKLKNVLVKTDKFSSLGQVSMELFHEIKNILMTMNTSIYYLEKNIDQTDSKVRKHIEIIKKEIQHSNKIIMSLLNFSRGKEDKETELNINEPIEEILTLMEAEFLLNSIKVIKNLTPDIDKIKGNQDKLKQVFLNFVLNAKEAMPEGGELRITTYNENKFVMIEFSDTGEGISEGNRHKIFEPFFSTKEDKDGVGLGLTVSRDIIKNHNGEIRLISNRNKGASFLIKFPILK